MTWGGQLQIVTRLIYGYDPGLTEIMRQKLNLDGSQLAQAFAEICPQLEFTITYQVLPLQDCIDLATFMVRTTIIAQGLAISIRGVGGPIEVATITRTQGFEYVQRKMIHGEQGLLG